jgi:hypothetical protein
MMLRRMLSSVAINKNCSHCRLYNRATKTCKLNNLDAFTNRLNDSICGTDGKKFWALDDKHLIKSKKYEQCAGFTGFLAITSFSIALYSFNIVYVFPSYFFYVIYEICIDLSDEAKKKYLDGEDN